MSTVDPSRGPKQPAPDLFDGVSTALVGAGGLLLHSADEIAAVAAEAGSATLDAASAAARSPVVQAARPLLGAFAAVPGPVRWLALGLVLLPGDTPKDEPAHASADLQRPPLGPQADASRIPVLHPLPLGAPDINGFIAPPPGWLGPDDPGPSYLRGVKPAPPQPDDRTPRASARTGGGPSRPPRGPGEVRVDGQLHDHLLDPSVRPGDRVVLAAFMAKTGASIFHAQGSMTRATHAGYLDMQGKQGMRVVPGAREALLAADEPVAPLPDFFRPVDTTLPRHARIAAVEQEVLRVAAAGHVEVGAWLPTRRELTAGLGLDSAVPVVRAYARLAERRIVALEDDGRVRLIARPAGAAPGARARTFEAVPVGLYEHLDAPTQLAIRSGIRLHYAEGKKLPGDRRIAAETGVPVAVVERVMALLHGEGLVERSAGRGTISRAGVEGKPARRHAAEPGLRLVKQRLVARFAQQPPEAPPVHLGSLAVELGVASGVLLRALQAVRHRAPIAFYQSAGPQSPDALKKLDAPLVHRADRQPWQSAYERLKQVHAAGGWKNGELLSASRLSKRWRIDPSSVSLAFDAMVAAGQATREGLRYRAAGLVGVDDAKRSAQRARREWVAAERVVEDIRANRLPKGSKIQGAVYREAHGIDEQTWRGALRVLQRRELVQILPGDEDALVLRATRPTRIDPSRPARVRVLDALREDLRLGRLVEPVDIDDAVRRHGASRRSVGRALALLGLRASAPATATEGSARAVDRRR